MASNFETLNTNASKIYNQINWLLFTVLTIIGANILILYTWYWGGLNTTIKFEKEIIKKADSLICAKEKDAKYIELIKERKQILESIKQKTDVTTLPFLGISLHLPDFNVCSFIVGTIFILWLQIQIGSLRNILKTYFNKNSSFDEDDEGLFAQFYLFLPGKERKITNYVEVILLAYIIMILFFTYSDFNDLTSFYFNSSGSKPIFEKIVSDVMTVPATLKFIFDLICIIATIFIYKFISIKLKDIKNLLLLLRWTKTALMPSIQEELNLQLIPNNNFVEYRIIDSSNKNKLFLYLNFDGVKKSIEFISNINLAKSIRIFSKNHAFLDSEIRPFFDKYLNRVLTFEEIFMRSYFRTIMRDQYYEKDFRAEFNQLKNNVK